LDIKRKAEGIVILPNKMKNPGKHCIWKVEKIQHLSFLSAIYPKQRQNKH